VPLDNSLADSQSNAGAAIVIPLVKPLEHTKNSVEVLGINSQPIVTDRKRPFVLLTFGGGDVNAGGVQNS